MGARWTPSRPVSTCPSAWRCRDPRSPLGALTRFPMDPVTATTESASSESPTVWRRAIFTTRSSPAHSSTPIARRASSCSPAPIAPWCSSVPGSVLPPWSACCTRSPAGLRRGLYCSSTAPAIAITIRCRRKSAPWWQITPTSALTQFTAGRSPGMCPGSTTTQRAE